MRRTALLLVFVPGLLLAACGADAAETDVATEHLTAKDLGRTVEAREYLAGEGGVWTEVIPVGELGEWTEALYAAGAERVLFADVGDIEGIDLTSWFVVKLPSAGTKRRAVFAAFNAVMAKYEEDARTDRGQAYLDLALD